MFQKIKDTWKGIKAWFNYSWSIFIARMWQLAGVIAAGVVATDWSGLISSLQTGVDYTKLLTSAAVMLAIGIVTEAARRQGTTTLSDGQLVPSNVSEKKEAIAVIKGETR